MALRIVYEGDEAAAKSYLPQAQNLLHKVREFVAASGAGYYSSKLVLDDSTYAYALKTGDMEVIHIFSLPTPVTKPVPYEYKEIPLFLSGVVRGGYIATETLPPIPGESQPRKIKKLQYFKPTRVAQLRNRVESSGYDSYRRLAVKLHEKDFSDLPAPAPATPPDLTGSQYSTLRPSNYTGRMAKLVQVVLGYGRLPNHQVIEKDPATRTTVLREGIQLVYDCRFMRSHGVVKGEGDIDWIVEISALNGVIAMRLPVYPKSQALRGSDQTDIAAAAVEFAGLPTGQGFPTGKALAAGIKSGAILQLLTAEEMEPFYALQEYSSMCGWAFNSKGTEAHNTGWRFGDDGMREGLHYRVEITIGKLLATVEPNEPIAVASARLVEVEKGKLYYEGTGPELAPHPQFKYHEPLFEGLISFFLLPQDLTKQYSKSIVCDTAVHVYFTADDQLKTVRYFYDRNGSTEEVVTTDFPDLTYDPMLIGSWTFKRVYGDRRIPAMFYTSDVDDREVQSGGTQLIEVTSQKAGTEQFVQGSGSNPYGYYNDETFGTELINGQEVEDTPEKNWIWATRAGSYHRNTIFMQEYVRTNSGTARVRSSVIIPEGIREGYVYGRLRLTDTIIKDYSVSYKEVRQVFAANVIYRPDTGETLVWTVSQGEYPPGLGGLEAAVADEGPWTAQRDVAKNETWQLEGYTTYDVTAQKSTLLAMLYTAHESGGLPLYMPATKPLVDKEWVRWARFSPNTEPDSEDDDATGDTTQEMAAFHSSALGEKHMVYETRINSKPEARKGIGSMVQDVATTGKRDLYNFIGVL